MAATFIQLWLVVRELLTGGLYGLELGALQLRLGEEKSQALLVDIVWGHCFKTRCECI